MAENPMPDENTAGHFSGAENMDNSDGEGDCRQGFSHSQHAGSDCQKTAGKSKQANAGGQEDDEQEYLTEEDIENFLLNEEKAAEEGNTYNIDSQLKPHLRQQFRTKEESQEFFNFYSNVAGFSSIIVSQYKTISKKRNNEVTRYTMKCNRYGRNTEIPREQLVPQRQSTVISRTDCKCEMVATEKAVKWEITRLNLEHNHELTPNSRFVMRAHKYMSEAETDLIRTLKLTNNPTRKIVSILAYIRGGIAMLPYDKKHVSNYGTKINREMHNTDMMEVVSIFNAKQAETPGFYYSFELDAENKVRSIFWTDERCRISYEQCGECVSFDTTFLTNKYNMPFAPFVGVSNHAETTLFACALIINETAKTFEWVFSQFLMAMNGVPPRTIITDQDKAMEVAISNVFPDAVHRGCLFHVNKKAEEKIGPCFRANEGLYEEFQDIIDNILTVEEFESSWQEMICRFEVQHIKFFDTMWKSRAKFVPVYFKDKFFPFIQTTARSEGMNALFKTGVGAKFSITSFLREYQNIIDVIHDNEDHLDYKVLTKKVPTDRYWSKLYIERQAHHLYNLSIFRKFQWKLEDTTRLQLVEYEKDKVYLVSQAENYALKEHRTRIYLMQMDAKERDYSCICCGFQKDGILCSHILKVMIHLNVPEIPEKYIIDRWRKKDKRLNISQWICQPIQDKPSLRFNMLSKRLVRVAATASQTKRKSEYLLQEMIRIEKVMAEMDSEDQQTVPLASTSTRTVTHVPSSGESVSSTSIQLQDPDIANTKGRPRLLTIREAIKQNKFYHCGHCGSSQHTKKNCTNLDKEYNLPIKKRSRSKNATNADKDGSGKNKRSKKQKAAPAGGEQSSLNGTA